MINKIGDYRNFDIVSINIESASVSVFLNF